MTSARGTPIPHAKKPVVKEACALPYKEAAPSRTRGQRLDLKGGRELPLALSSCVEGAASLYGSAQASVTTGLWACGVGVPLAPSAHAALLPQCCPEHVVCNSDFGDQA